MDIITYALLNKKVKGLTSGIKSAVVQGTSIIFTMNDGSQATMSFPVPADGKDGIDGKDGANGVSITDVDINKNDELICTLSDGSTINAGKFPDSGEEILLEDYNKLTEEEKKSHPWYVPDDDEGNSGGIFDRTEPTLTTVGGLSAGSSIYGKTANEVIEEMLYPYQEPTVSFSISPNTTVYEIGNTISSIVFTITATKKSKDIQAIEIYDGSTLVTTLESKVANGGTFTYTYDCSITTNTTLKVNVSDGTSTASASKNISFVSKSYYGFVTDGVTVNEAVITALQNNIVKTTKVLNYAGISFVNSRIVYAYPQSLGRLSSITDDNGFGYIDSYTCEILTIGGVNYYVYTMIDPTTVDNFKQKYE